jgi:cytoskeletal protein CcmA (bactofilin family)
VDSVVHVQDEGRGIMKRTTRWAAVATVVGAMLLSGGPAAAEERVCRGTIGAATVDNLRVPQGATCTLNGTYVKGTVKVEQGATLKAFGVRVVGNVQAENARKVVVREGSRIGGSVQIVQGGAAQILGNRINGDILFDDQGRALRANRNVVGGSLQAFQNTGGLEIRKNRIDGNLQCKENDPAPVGGGNIVQGNKEDQCAGL